jgi:hypothetical protein
MKGKIIGKYNMVPYFKFLTVECILQDEGKNSLGNMPACVDIDKHGRFKYGDRRPLLQEQEYGRKQRDIKILEWREKSFYNYYTGHC